MITSTSLTIGTKTHYSVLYEILETWRGKKSNGAKLHTLICILENRGLQNCADALKLKFCICEDALVEEETKALELVEIVDPDFGSTTNLLPNTNADEEESEENTRSRKMCIILHVLPFLLGYIGFVVWILVYALARKSNHADLDVQITVKSYLEYDSKMKEIPSYYRVSLFINVTDPMDWEGTFSLKNVDKVTGIFMKGPVPIKSLFQILNQSAHNLATLIITDDQKNNSLSICNYTNKEETPIYYESITFPMLQHLDFFGASCVNIFKLFKSNTYPTSVANFSFDMENLDLNEYSEGFIEHVAFSSKKSLRQVWIMGINKGPGFWTFGSQKLPVLQNVSSLLLHSFFMPSPHFNVTDFDIHHLLNDVFPNVEKLVLDGFILPQSFFESTLSFMKSLVDLDVGVAVEGMVFDFNCIPNRVKKADVYLAFKSCNSSGISLFNMDHSRMEDMEYIRVAGNCRSFMVEGPFILSDKVY
ncbi:unnamed protein product [Orchesella dallaii]|uniref:Uncharacterized protein n=1 Tax=Orchesella dallaii TaxID=48710 RepID=A0ABP1RL88_9HEXA